MKLLYIKSIFALFVVWGLELRQKLRVCKTKMTLNKCFVQLLLKKLCFLAFSSRVFLKTTNICSLDI